MDDNVSRERDSHSIASVIICTYNRAHLLKRVLRSLTKQSLPLNRFEVIVVDDGSQDDTAKLCDVMSRELPNFKYISLGTNSGKANACNAGIEKATGNHILFTDDDCIAANNWVERMNDALEQEAIVAGAIASPTGSYLKLCHNIAELHHFMPGQKEGQREFIAGANMGFRRSVLEELRGFGEGTDPVDDMELILRARTKGYGIYYVPDALVTHDPERTTLSSIFGYSAEHASRTILLRNEYRALLRTPFVLRSPALLLAAAPAIALKVTWGIYLRNPRIAKLFWTAPMVYALKLAWCWGAARSLRDSASSKIDSGGAVREAKGAEG
ncbi:MAG: glycosyltransferase family 2 protein [bacterium]|nr:glycosyltransferase family 2 protein [bacterium]